MEKGDDKSLNQVQNLMPRRVKKRRKIDEEEGGGWEEYFDYIFPEDEGAKPNLKLLAMAKMWKKQKEEATKDESQACDSSVVTFEEQSKAAEPNVDAAEPNIDADDDDIKNEESSSEEEEEEKK